MDITVLPDIINSDELYQKNFISSNILRCTVGTSGPCGGDAGHGSWIELCLEDEASTCWEVLVDNKRIYQPRRIMLRLRGDAEIDTFTRALGFALKFYKLQIESANETRRLFG